MKKNWNPKQIEQHIEAAKKLGIIKDEVKQFLAMPKTATTEKDVLNFIKKRYKAHGLVNDSKKEFAICAFREHTKEVHYFASSTTNYKLKTDNLLLIDIWAHLDKKDAPYADMTWMFWVVNSKKLIANREYKNIQKTWEVLLEARNTAINFIKKELKKGTMPRGLDIDRVAYDVIGKVDLGRGIKHTIGHSLGFDSPHGKLPGINWKEYSPLLKNIGYTIEPGIYLENFGTRTEIDFYINNQNKVIITTPTQKTIDLIN